MNAKTCHCPFTATILFICLASNLSAEEPARPGFFSFEGGPAFTQDAFIHDSEGAAKFSFDPGLRFDLRMGGQSERGIGLDIDLGVIYSPLKGNPLVADTGNLDLYQVPIMLDITYTSPRFGPFKAYVGAGIGGVYGVFTGSGTSLLGFSTDLTFGYQGTAGIKYAITDRWDFSVAYRFLGTTDHDLSSGVSMDGIFTHSFLAAFTYRF